MIRRGLQWLPAAATITAIEMIRAADSPELDGCTRAAIFRESLGLLLMLVCRSPQVGILKSDFA